MAAGRPSKYSPQFHPKLAELLAARGLTDREISAELEITEATLNNWKKRDSKFFESLKKGKDRVDDRVESALLRNALGYDEDDVKIFQYEGEPVIVPYTKRHKPDVTSQIFWLKNRRPERWRDKKEIELPADALPITINVVGIKNSGS